MATVVAEMTMSLDGFVADPSDGVQELFGWYDNGDVAVPTADPERWTWHTSEASAGHLRDISAVKLSNAPIELDVPKVIEGTGVTHLYYSVRTPDRAATQ